MNAPAPFAKRALSQNFLIDSNIIHKIIRAVDLQAADHILEIGPGRGALTFKIAPAVQHFTAIEKDSTLIQQLDYKANMDLIEADFLTFDLTLLTEKAPLKLISNLPYNISTKAVKKIALYKHLFSSVYLMVQNEFADKLISKPSSSLSALAQYHFDIHKLFTISPYCFCPKPNVTSAFISLIPNRRSISESQCLFFTHCFEGKRKQLFNILKTHYSEKLLHRAWLELNLPTQIRIEELTPLQIQSLYAIVSTHPSEIEPSH
ncbi:MAG: 16S rRNA (adenine(1518)-N(6)/adenine(1519)-N(6))-dimethyltransferase RsmA [Simkaniaceae bacterium]|nr:16S rRNA (adenine(1518)-N(6)/adenine(1519)-N(6))-dimethyltransferase RsmA [Simkaniaceae bacterium]